jgi:hypothetical protein
MDKPSFSDKMNSCYGTTHMAEIRLAMASRGIIRLAMVDRVPSAPNNHMVAMNEPKNRE